MNSRNEFGQLAQSYFKTGLGAEIGVERGHFTLQTLSGWKGKTICVDMWVNEPIYQEACNNLASNRVTMVKKSSVEAAKEIPDNSLDWVYIDADHTYEACKSDLEAWLPKVRHGGLVAGHDYLTWKVSEGGGCDFGVKEYIDEFCAKNGYPLSITTDDFWNGDPYPTWYFTKQIPKIIYYTWINPKPLPYEFEKYINGWRVKMPDYEIRQISLDNVVKSPFVNEAIKRKLYSVAGHYGRVESIYETGGIYFDIDIEADKRFDSLLSEKFFAGCETPYRVNNACFGSVAKHGFLFSCLDFMNDFDFNNPGKFGIEIETGPEMFTQIAKSYGWKELNETQRLSDMTIFNSKYFYPYYFNEPYKPGCVTDETYAVHHWAKTW